MFKRLMMTTAAAALIAGTGFAHAQGMNRETPSAGAGTQQSAPTDRGPAAAAAEEKMQPQGGKTQRTQGDMKSGPKSEKSAQENNTNNNMKGEKPNSMRSETNDKGAAGKDMKAEDRNGTMNADSKGAADNKSQTVGQAGAGAKLSTEQHTRITSVIRDQHVAPVTSVNFSIAVGTRIPRDVTFHPLPTEIVTIYPDWRGYEFILVNDQIVVVNPQTFEIVAVIDA
ncbi:DUF1236 domain-containing protein [Bradyrhizobium sp.]|jgi:hypothetical protein|uniref:DUF1236 domain-containing protein n=1 Tax=Bradyrhizobium sp. TaxID=376 RepID=UPI003D150FA1